MKARSNSSIADYTAKADPDSPTYRDKVAVPTMTSVDSMPLGYRELVNEFGYIEVYIQWRRGRTLAQVRDMLGGPSRG